MRTVVISVAALVIYVGGMLLTQHWRGKTWADVGRELRAIAAKLTGGRA